MRTRKIKVDYLSRVEGEGAMYVEIKDNKVADVKFKIFEPPRFFEAFLRGRNWLEAPDITARICGICPVAYLMGASQAMENIIGVKVEGQLRELRRLLYCGEWIESHVLHAFMLHLPDFLGYPDAIQMAKDHKDAVETALRLKKLGNGIMTILGGREVHPINVKVGGFYKVPSVETLHGLMDELKWGLKAAVGAAELFASLKFQDFEQDYNYIALSNPHEYPIIEGNLISNRGLNVPISDYDKVLMEKHVEHSNALQGQMKDGTSCHTGPLARFNLNYDKLTPVAKETAKKLGLAGGCHNPFKSIIIRAIEVIFAIEESMRIIDQYKAPKDPFVPVKPKAGTGYGCTEAPRGICYHRYTINGDGIIQDAKIASPTTLNQKVAEDDLYRYVTKNINASDEELKFICEQAIRNYDPCISCSAHFLKLQVVRS